VASSGPDSPVLTELGAGGACFEDAVGDQHEPVGGDELHGLGAVGGALEHPGWELSVELERLGPAVPDQPRPGVPGVHDLQLAVGEVQAHREGCDELDAAELLQELLVGSGDLLVGAAAGAPDVAHDRGGEGGEQARADAVVHRVQAGRSRWSTSTL